MTVIGTATGAVFQTARNKLSITAKPENHFLTKAARVHALREARYGVIEKWEYDQKTHEALPIQERRAYPHAVLYDFESYFNKVQKKEVTDALRYENVSIGDGLECVPTRVCDANKKELIKRFVAELEAWGRHPNPGQSRIHAGRQCPVARKGAQADGRMV